MDVERRLERLCERVTLVNSIGSRRRDELCVMSFVALLAGERHTDHPASASPRSGISPSRSTTLYPMTCASA